MAVRKGEDRSLGSDAEKLLTLEEAAGRLNRSADEVETMIRTGALPAFRLGGSLLRVRLKDVETLRTQTVPHPEGPRTSGRMVTVDRSVPLVAPPSPSLGDRIMDFLHFNDFYLVAVLVVLTLLAVIFAL